MREFETIRGRSFEKVSKSEALKRLSRHGFDVPKEDALPISGETVKAVTGIMDGIFPRGRYESSYHLKHVAERILGYYVGNGEFIKAAILSGRPFRIGYKSLNAIIK